MKKTKYPCIYREYKPKFERDCFMLVMKFNGKLLPKKNLTMLFGITNIEIAKKKKDEILDKLRMGENPFEVVEEKKKEIKLNDYWKYEFENYKQNNKKRTYDMYERFWNLYLNNTIGNKYISELKTFDIEAIRNSDRLINASDNYKSLLRRLLKPIFEKAKVDGFVKENIFNAIKFKTNYQANNEDMISERTNLNHLEIAKILYNYVPSYNSQYGYQKEELKIFLYLFLMTGRRYGELFELETKHIKLEENKILSSKDITKTKKKSGFPIPLECLDWIEEKVHKKHEGKLFQNIEYGSFYGIFQRFRKKALGDNDFKMSAHDNRSLLVSSMICLNIDSRMADFCLDHEQDKREIHKFYLDLSYEAKVKAYEKYWAYLRKNHF